MDPVRHPYPPLVETCVSVVDIFIHIKIKGVINLIRDSEIGNKKRVGM